MTIVIYGRLPLGDNRNYRERLKVLHTHISALNAVIVLAYILVIGFMLRTIQYRYPDSEVSKALAFIY